MQSNRIAMSRNQLKRLKEPEKESCHLRRAVSDLTLDKMILTEAARGLGQRLNQIGAVPVN